MHTGALRKWALALTFWLALHMSALKAQVFTAPLQASTTGTDPVDFEFRADGTLIAKGNFGVGSLLTADQGDGTRMLWFPSLGAFRAGTVSTGLSLGDGPWDADNIGSYSAAFGYNTTASGGYATAFGYNTQAWGEASFVAGYGSTAGTSCGIALGLYAYAGGPNSVALGSATNATGLNATAMGDSTTASGWWAVASGRVTTASGLYSTASGSYTTASGSYATVAGLNTTASAYASFVVGAFNAGLSSTGATPSATTWVATDPLFEVGNGSSGSGYGNPAASGPSDALVVYKNGSATFQGPVTVAPGGDIPMYTGE
jgi:hypothetical protein